MNALSRETSPYLLQHAENPVAWYPWGKEALDRAKSEKKPILLSIGYSACHWCHVMAHESFEDPEVAEVMNSLYINIKVDREERPDLDKIYQLAHQAITQRGGGWPLTMFLTPDEHLPIFAGTYFPKHSRQGMPGYIDVLKRVEEFYRQHPTELNRQTDQLRTFFDNHESSHPVTATQIDSAWLTQAQQNLQANFDHTYAGFGNAPKFPHPTNLERLMRHWSATRANGNENQGALELARLTLHAMASGGIYDQLGGGFCRYSVDEQWAIPHFEKMLYDNGPLLALYAEAWNATGKELFRRIAEETGDWVIREMQSPDGGYYSTLDADSEGEEGKFYIWSPTLVDALLDHDTAEIIKRHYGLNSPANFEGHWHLVVKESVEAISDLSALTAESVLEKLAAARKLMFSEREKRAHPGRDEKILTSWNGLMIRGMAIAGRRLGLQSFIHSAEQSLEFIRTNLWQDGRLLAASKDGKSRLNAYLDDYVFLIDGIITLLEARWKNDDFQFAIDLIEVVLKHFESTEGGFYFTSDDHESLIQRPQSWMDEAIPSGNGIAALVLIRLGYLTGEPRYISAAERTLKSAASSIQDYPHAHCSLLHAVEEYLTPTETIILRGPVEELSKWTSKLNTDYAPARMVFAIPSNITTGSKSLDGYAPAEHGVLAYVCRAGACEAPIQEISQIDSVLTERNAS